MADKKIKIAFIVPSLQNGGAERMVAALSNFFSKKFEVVIICLLEKEIFYKISDDIEIHYAREASPSQNSFSAIFNNFITVRNILKIVRQKRIHILIGFTTQTNVLSIISSILAKIPCVISERNNSKVNPPNIFWLSLRNFFYRFSFRLVVQTEGNLKIFSEIMPITKIQVIENAIAESLEFKMRSKRKLSKVIKILTVGRLNPNKAHEISLTALSNLLDYEWNFTIVGDGPSKTDLMIKSKILGIEDRVKFTGSIKNVEDYYKDSDIFIFTSKSEGFPNALMEAYYFGVPCISTNCDYGPSEIITDGVDGYLIPINDHVELQNKLKILLSQTKTRQNISKAASGKASRFKMSNIAMQWDKLIHSALNTNS